jgi:glutaminyl-peptide cyclotransferase
MKKLFVAALCAALLATGCEQNKKAETTVTRTEELTLVPSPEFNEDSALAFVKAQVDFGPRVPNTQSHIRCGNYLINKFREFGWEITEQPFEAKAFNGTVLNSRNIIASYNPGATKRILLASHWDTRPFADQDTKDTLKPIDGANDGASGVGVLLEVARVIQQSQNKPEVGIDVILFDAEDYGQPDYDNTFNDGDTWCLGSQYWSKNKHKPGYTAYYGILLDMVGGKSARFAQDDISMQYAPSVMKKVWDIGNKLGYSSYFRYERAGGFTDDHYYVNTIAKIPMIDIIEYEPSDGTYFSTTWHTHEDTIENIDKNTLKAVGKTVLQTVYQEKK